jgi:DNA-binding SARP family transcriptional activator/ATP/maltotriose-dependent transcriptional regulator MalT
MSRLRLLFLGPVQLMRDGQPVELSAAKAIALLAYLASQDQPQTREHVTDLLWPESLPDAARKNLRNTLWAVRKALGEEVLVQPDVDYLLLSDAVWVDVRAFEADLRVLSGTEAPDISQLQAAIGLYRAPLLEGLTLSEAPDFEIWLSAERERLGQLYLRALKTLMGAYRAAGRWSDVISVAQQALAQDNLQEPTYRALMEAYARLGERSQALHQYEQLRTTLERELSVEPLPETEALRAAIASGDLGPVGASTFQAPAPPRRPPRTDSQPVVPFIGRQAERAALDQELHMAAAGHTRVVLILGEVGIGKSRLWQEWSAAQPPDLIALETRCLDTTQSLPFAPLTGLFSRQVCIDHLFTPPSPLSPVWLAELARLLPAVREAWPDLPAPTHLPPEEERYRLFEAFTQTLRALEAKPLVLFIDDLHWADRATLDWLVYLLDRFRDEPLLVVGAYRPIDAPAQLVNLAVEWTRKDIARRLELKRLAPEETAQLIEALGGDVTQAEQLHMKSAGNPYVLIELSRAGPDDTPSGLTALMHARLSRLPESARQVLQAAAVLEPDFDFDALRRTSGRGEEETLDGLDSLLEAHILVERGRNYEFDHPLVASLVRNNLSIARRSFLHRRAAKALEATHVRSLASVAGQLAMHYADAGDTSQAAQYAEMAARRALELTAPTEAVAFYHQALSLEPTPRRRLGLGQALYLQGELAEARQVLSEALAESEAAGDREGQAQACLALADSYLPSGQGDMVIQWAECALASLDLQHNPEDLSRAHYLLGAGGIQVGRSLVEAEAHLAQASHLARENHLPEMSTRSQFELGNLMAQQGELQKALDAFARTIALAQTADASFLEILGHNNLAYHAQLAGDLPTAREHIQQGLALAEAHSLFIPRQYLYSTRGEIALAEGQLDEAESWFKRGLVEADKYDNRRQAANIHANLGLVAQARGDLDGALIELEGARRAVTAISAPHLQIKIDLWMAELYLQRGEQACARTSLAHAEVGLAGGERRGLQAWAERLRAQLPD